MTSAQQIGGGRIVGIPENFVQELLLHLANSHSTQMMLHHVQMNFEAAPIPIPTFLKQLLNEKEQYPQFGGRTLFEESFELNADNGRTLRIFDGELRHYYYDGDGDYEMILIVQNKMDRKNWFQIAILVDNWTIQQMNFSRLDLQPLNWLKDYQIEENGNKLEAMQNIWWKYKWDLFLRRGTAFTQIRHFKIKKPYSLRINRCAFVISPYSLRNNDYDNFLISYISNTKHPEEFLESIDINLDYLHHTPFVYKKIWKICQKGIPEGGISINIGTEKLHILSAKTDNLKMKCLESLQFTLANIPTNGEYVFDFDVQLKNGIVGVKIKKRKIDNFVGLKCNDQIEMTIDDEEEDGPTYSDSTNDLLHLSKKYREDVDNRVIAIYLFVVIEIAGILFLIYRFGFVVIGIAGILFLIYRFVF